MSPIGPFVHGFPTLEPESGARLNQPVQGPKNKSTVAVALAKTPISLIFSRNGADTANPTISVARVSSSSSSRASLCRWQRPTIRQAFNASQEYL